MLMTGVFQEAVYHLTKNYLQLVDGVEIVKFGVFLIVNLELSLKDIQIELLT